MFSSVNTSWNSVSSWLGVGQRPKDEDAEENKENTPDVKDSNNSTLVEESSSTSKDEAGLQTQSTEGETKTTASSTGDTEASPLDSIKDINLEEVSAKALSTAKEFGSILFSFGKTALKHGTETATQLKHAVEEKTILGDFAKEQDKFCESKREQTNKAEAAVPPWVGYNDEESLRTQITGLSLDKRNFVRNPPSGVQFQFDFEACFPVAMATLQDDKNLEKMRFDLVPKAVNEETFWRNYFYRVSLIRQSSQLNSSLSALEAEDAANKSMDLYNSEHGSRSSSRRSSTGTSNSDHKSEKEGSTTPKDIEKAQAEQELAASSPDNDDFVSDAFEESGITEDDIRREMEEQIKGEGDKKEELDDEDWKKKLEEKLFEQKVQDAVIDDGEAIGEIEDEEEWEKELMDEIMEEMKE